MFLFIYLFFISVNDLRENGLNQRCLLACRDPQLDSASGTIPSDWERKLLTFCRYIVSSFLFSKVVTDLARVPNQTEIGLWKKSFLLRKRCNADVFLFFVFSASALRQRKSEVRNWLDFKDQPEFIDETDDWRIKPGYTACRHCYKLCMDITEINGKKKVFGNFSIVSCWNNSLAWPVGWFNCLVPDLSNYAVMTLDNHC